MSTGLYVVVVQLYYDAQLRCCGIALRFSLALCILGVLGLYTAGDGM